MSVPPLVAQSLLCVVVLALMVVSGLQRRRLELRRTPLPRLRRRTWLFPRR